MKAELNNYRQAPRKVRLVADVVRGKTVPQALIELQFLGKRAAMPFAKLIASAAANAANNHKAESGKLVVKSVSVTKGPTLKRGKPVSRGSTHRINKRTSILKVELAVK
ncbi:MAG: ribosomal protein large subunit ribosomal protein [Patescibacteria group bacterium]|nr:ribosomal protein large subunit ribosomal protein [Patescibacteria group bacterium]